MKKTPKISVGMPVYNGEAYLEEAILCILNQTYGDFELIISDNASKDRTEAICQDFAIGDKRISYVRNRENLGAAENYNSVFRHTVGKYFRWFNSDDLCDKTTHERCLAVLEEHPNAVLSYGKTAMIDGKSKITSHYDDKLDLQQESVVERYKMFSQRGGLTNVIYGLMRRSAVEKTMLMGDSSYHAADINFMAELTLYGLFIEIPEILFFRRMHEQASSWDRKDEKAQQEFWKGKNKPFVFPYWKKNISYIRAIRNTSISSLEKRQLQKFIVRNMIWSRQVLFKELVLEAKYFFSDSR